MSRPIDVPGTFNFREVHADLADGRNVKRGALYRSDSLAGLTRAGRAAVARLGVTRVIDLRSSFDRRFGGADRLRGTGVELVEVPIVAGAPASRDLSGLNLRGIYRAVLEHQGEAVGTAIRAIAGAPDGAVVVHCTAGKDRSGLVVALVLLALGADVDDVVADYAATEQHLAGKWADRMIRKVRWMRVTVTPELREVLVGSPEGALRDTLTWLEEKHGGVLPYLRSIGVDDDVVGRLRAFLVQDGGNRDDRG